MIQRRTVVLAAAAAALPVGCATPAAFPAPRIGDDPPAGLQPILAPQRIVKAPAAPTRVIDVHAHFFNARDVPVSGYLGGPVAHSRPGPVGDLMRLLAPLAEQLALLAPDALTEWQDLIGRAGSARVQAVEPAELRKTLDAARQAHLQAISPKVFEILRGSRFEAEFNRHKGAVAPGIRSLQGTQGAPLGADSLFNVMQRDRPGPTPGAATLSLDSPAIDELPPYTDGVLAFLGYMLSYRWMNLLAYQQAYSTQDGAFGVDRVLGALVDFDHWLMPPPHVAHEDQIRLHQLLSQLSGGYMLPLVAYNPWTDARSGGQLLRQRVLDAIDHRGFVGVKIYPPNGFRPLGNSRHPLAVHGAPTPDELDQALLAMWRACAARDVPVMAHSGHSMGSDDAHEDMAGPLGWQDLLTAFEHEKGPVANTGHFGGEDPRYAWTEDIAALMDAPGGSALYADLGYWSELRCNGAHGACSSRPRLQQALQRHPVAAQRLMYGSDWLMLSQERRWDRYPAEIAAATRSLVDPDALFGGNAMQCFRRLTAVAQG